MEPERQPAFLEVTIDGERESALLTERAVLFAPTDAMLDPGSEVSLLVHLPRFTFAARGRVDSLRFAPRPGLVLRIVSVEAASHRASCRYP